MAKRDSVKRLDPFNIVQRFDPPEKTPTRAIADPNAARGHIGPFAYNTSARIGARTPGNPTDTKGLKTTITMYLWFFVTQGTAWFDVDITHNNLRT